MIRNVLLTAIFTAAIFFLAKIVITRSGDLHVLESESSGGVEIGHSSYQLEANDSEAIGRSSAVDPEGQWQVTIGRPPGGETGVVLGVDLQEWANSAEVLTGESARNWVSGLRNIGLLAGEWAVGLALDHPPRIRGGAPSSALQFSQESAAFEFCVSQPENTHGNNVSILAAYRLSPDSARTFGPVALWECLTKAGDCAKLPCIGVPVTVFISVGTETACWVGNPSPGDRVVIELGSGWKLTGGVQRELSDEVIGRTVLSLRTGEHDLNSQVACTSAAPGGGWEFPELFGLGGQSIWIRLMSDTCLLEDHPLTCPEHGGREVHQLLCESSCSQVVVALTGADEPIVACKVQALWIDEESNRWVTAQGSTGAEGTVEFASLPFADAYFRILDPRYSAELIGPHSVPRPQGRAVILYPSVIASLTGRVMQDGMAVTEFGIRWWREGESPNVQKFEAAEGGQFILEAIPSGPVWVMAESEMLGLSAPTVVEVSLANSSSVNLELQGLQRVTGFAVDRETGDPVQGAHIGSTTLRGGWTLSQDAWEVTGVDGRIKSLLVPAAGGAVIARHSEFMPFMHVLPPRDVDDPALRLEFTASGEFAVQLASQSPIDFEGVQLDCPVSSAPGYIAFDVNGLATISSAPTAVVLGAIYPPWHGYVHYEFSPREFSGRIVPICLDTGRTVTVAVDFKGSPPWVELRFQTAAGVRISAQRRVSPDTRSAAFTEIDADVVHVTVFDNGRQVFHSVQDTPLGGDVDLAAAVGDEFIEVLVLDEHGGPMSSEIVHMHYPRAPSTATTYDLDANGWLKLPDSLGDAGVAVMSSQSRCLLWWARVSDLRNLPNGTLGVIAAHRLRFVCRHGGDPVPSAKVSLHHPRIARPLAAYRTGVDGATQLIGFAVSELEASVSLRGYWPVRFDVSLNGGEAVRVIELRKVSVLEPIWSGGDIQGREVLILEDRQSRQDVGAWLRDGRAAGGGLSPDDAEMRVSGIPEGEYLWSVHRDGMEIARGTIEVLPGVINTLELELD